MEKDRGNCDVAHLDLEDVVHSSLAQILGRSDVPYLLVMKKMRCVVASLILSDSGMLFLMMLNS